MYKVIMVISAVWISLSCYGQDDCHLDYQSPIGYKTVLSGSYGEPRTRHFHAGIDYKQRKGVPYDTIYSIEQGFVSRISVQSGGYGNALYINHPCNQTSVYAHLHHYSQDIQDYADSVMYARKTYAVDLNPLELGDTIRVSKGGYIGIMGNTGRSSGPHLHFEIRETKTEIPINPALLGFKPKDDIAPDIVGIYLYEFTPDDEEVSRKYYPATLSKSGVYTIDKNPIITGAYKVGVGIRTYDRMNGASNHNGIYSLDMFVDGQSRFGFTLDSIPFEDAKYIHTHMDYREKKAKKYVTQCFLSNINALDIYRTDETRGFIDPFTYRSTDVNIIVEDIEGNRSLLNVAIKRDDNQLYRIADIDTSKTRVPSYGAAQGKSAVSNEGTEVTFFDSTFSQPVRIRLGDYTADQIDLRQEVDIPTFRRYRVTHKYMKGPNEKAQYVLTSSNDKGEQLRHKTRWLNDSTIVSFLSELNLYQITRDTLAPTIEVIRIPGSSAQKCVFKVTDNLIPQHHTDDLKIGVFLDGKWILCKQDAKTDRISFEMPVERSNEKHEVLIKVEDASGNRNSLTRTFTY